MIAWISKGGRAFLVTTALVAVTAAALGHVGYAVGSMVVALIAYPKLNKPKNR